MSNEVQKSTAELINEEIARTNLEAAKLELEEKRLSVEERRLSVEAAKLKREGHALELKGRSKSLEDTTRTRLNKQASCSHRKGGRGKEGLLNGNDANYAVMKHILPTQEAIVRCTRCGKTWYPPAKSRFTHNGVFNESAFNQAVSEYKQALMFNTDNQTSRSTTFTIRDAKGLDITRDKTANFTEGFTKGL
jgi:predicted Zn finger-like uncharacterized protein